jgi:PRTRC genetic system protein E
MFAELLPILRNRALMITVGLVNDEAIRVHVIPKQVKNDDPGDCALTSPLTVTGTAEELDRDFAAQLVGFTNSFVKLGSNLSEIEASHTTAVKAVEAEKKKDLESKRKGAASKAPAAAAPVKREPEMKDGKPVFGSRISSPAEPLSLFDSREPGVPTTTAGQAAPGAPVDVTESGSAIDARTNEETQEEGAEVA